MSDLTTLTNRLDPTAVTVAALVCGTLLTLALIWSVSLVVRQVTRRRTRRAGQLDAMTPEQIDELRTREDRRRADMTTYAAAVIASGLSLVGMWPVVGVAVAESGLPQVLHTPAAVALLGFLEAAVLASGRRARANVRVTGSTGVDGAALWIIVAFSAVVATTQAQSLTGALVKAGAPVVAAWMWERGLAPERRAYRGEKPAVHWRLGLRRVAVALRLADPEEADLAVLARARRLGQVASHIVRAKRRRRPARRWSLLRAERGLIRSAARGDFTREGGALTLMDHIGLRAAAPHLVETNAPVPRDLFGLTGGPALAEVPSSTEPAVHAEPTATGDAPESPELPEKPAENDAENGENGENGLENPEESPENGGDTSENAEKPKLTIFRFTNGREAYTSAELDTARRLFAEYAERSGTRPPVNVVAKAINRRWERAKRVHDAVIAELSQSAT
ncbi:hypothetical protein [Streptomyces sp. MP131-18]|uniref:hypothetical protein n=1 Tax=Streptomyces sp. MP131-18 TaxID=1857892 RepID=UPI00097C63D2|nr:hypothetical protein [Streptomyces sp. MP131-18]ONK13287.1 hypothetical protein STBA_40500 [Streptomyces sp. MP131-18]